MNTIEIVKNALKQSAAYRIGVAIEQTQAISDALVKARMMSPQEAYKTLEAVEEFADNIGGIVTETLADYSAYLEDAENIQLVQTHETVKHPGNHSMHTGTVRESNPLDNLLPGLIRYRDEGIRPGSALSAFLSNDLRGFVDCADSNTVANMTALRRWCADNMPATIWGSADKVRSWLATPPNETAFNHGIDRATCKECLKTAVTTAEVGWLFGITFDSGGGKYRRGWRGQDTCRTCRG